MNIQAIHPSLVVTFAVAALMAVSAWAQERSSAPAPQRTDDTTLAEWLADKDARISELIGRRVVNPGGTDLGEVEDLLASAGREQEPVVVLSIGGVLDIGDKWHAASLEQLRIAPDGERLVLDKTEAELKAAASFDYVPMIGERSHQPGVRGPKTTNSVGRLLGATVVDDAGDSIGEIEDFVLSTGEKGTRAVVDLDEDAVPPKAGSSPCRSTSCTSSSAAKKPVRCRSKRACASTSTPRWSKVCPRTSTPRESQSKELNLPLRAPALGARGSSPEGRTPNRR